MIKIRHIRTKLLLLLFASALLCLGLFHTLWANKWYVLHLVTETNLPISLPIPQLDENFWTMLGTEALNYDIPDSEADTEAVKKLQPLFDQLDDYTGLAIYGMEDGIYRAAHYPRCMDKEQFQSFFDFFGDRYFIKIGVSDGDEQSIIDKFVCLFGRLSLFTQMFVVDSNSTYYKKQQVLQVSHFGSFTAYTF